MRFCSSPDRTLFGQSIQFALLLQQLTLLVAMTSPCAAGSVGNGATLVGRSLDLWLGSDGARLSTTRTARRTRRGVVRIVKPLLAISVQDLVLGHLNVFIDVFGCHLILDLIYKHLVNAKCRLIMALRFLFWLLKQLLQIL